MARHYPIPAAKKTSTGSAKAPASAKVGAAINKKVNKKVNVKAETPKPLINKTSPPLEQPLGQLFVVATPIGNLADITFRAVDTLKSCDMILAEDTRHSRALLSHYGILKPPSLLKSLHEHNEVAMIDFVLSALQNGQQLCLISDAGTPAISDPGRVLIQAVHQAGYRVTPIPGPSAAIAAFSASGVGGEKITHDKTYPLMNGFCYIGFLPQKPADCRRVLQRVTASSLPVIIYEAPHRLLKTLSLLSDVWGGDTKVFMAREITKRFEELRHSTLAALMLDYGQNIESVDLHDSATDKKILGEWVLIVSPPSSMVVDGDEADAASASMATLARTMQDELRVLLPPAQVAKVVHKVTGIDRDKIYQQLQHHK